MSGLMLVLRCRVRVSIRIRVSLGIWLGEGVGLVLKSGLGSLVLIDSPQICRMSTAVHRVFI